MKKFVSRLSAYDSKLAFNIGTGSNWFYMFKFWTGLSKYPLMYFGKNENQDFNDFNSFGGWNSPTAKRLMFEKKYCSQPVTFNYFK